MTKNQMLFEFQWNYISGSAKLLLYINNIINIIYLHFIFLCNLSCINITRYADIYIFMYYT